jgi:hypothetical protein
MAEKGNVGELSAQQMADIREEATALGNTVGGISKELKSSVSLLGKLIGENTTAYTEGFKASKTLGEALASVDAKTLASKRQQLDFSNKVRKAEEEATRLQAKANRLRAEMGQMSGKALEAAQRVSRSYERAADTLRDQARSARDITEQFEILNKKVKVFDDLAGFFAEVPGLSKVFGEFQRAADAAGEAASKGGSGFAAGAKELTGALGKGLATFGISTMLKGMKDADERTVDLSRNLNKSADESYRLLKNFNLAAVGIQGLTGAELQKGATILADSLGSTAVSSNSTAKELAGIVKTMGMSTEEAAKQAEFSQATGQDVAKAGNEMRGQIMLSNLRNKTSIKYQAIMKDVANTSNATKLLMQGQGVNITKAAIEAKKLGTTLEGISKIGASMLDFESSIAAELEAELLTGEEINNEKARALALQGNQLGLAKELERSGVLTKFANADNVLQQEALAKAYGVSKDEMADMVIKSRALKEMGAADSKDLQKKYRIELDKVEALKKQADLTKTKLDQEKYLTAEKNLQEKIGGEELERQLQNQTLQEKQAEAMSKLAEGMDAMLPLLRLIGRAFTYISTHARVLADILKGIASLWFIKKLLNFGKNITNVGDKVKETATKVAGTKKALSPKQLAAGFGGKAAMGAGAIPPAGGAANSGGMLSSIASKVAKTGIGSKIAGSTLGKVAGKALTGVGNVATGVANAAAKANPFKAATNAIKGPLGKIGKFMGPVFSILASIGSVYGEISDAKALQAAGKDVDSSALGKRMVKGGAYPLVNGAMNFLPGFGTAFSIVDGLLSLVGMSPIKFITDGIVDLLPADTFKGLGDLALGSSAKPKEKELPKHAKGGIFTSAQAGIIGEAGPEAVIPLGALYAKFDQLITATSRMGTPLEGLYAKMEQLTAVASKPSISLTGIYTKMDQLIAATSNKPNTKETKPETVNSLTGLYAKMDQLIAVTNKPVTPISLAGIYAKMDQLIAATSSKPITKEVKQETADPLTGLYAKLDQLIAATNKPVIKEAKTEIVIPLTGLYAKLDQLIAVVSKPTTKEAAPEITISLTGLYAKLDQLIAATTKPIAKEAAPEITISLTGLYAKLDQLISVASKPVIKETIPEIVIPLTGLYAKLDQLIAAATKPITKEVAPEINIPLTGLYAKLDQLIAVISKPIIKEVAPEITIPLTGLYAKLDQLITAVSKPTTKEVLPEINIPLTGLYAKLDQLIAVVSKPTTKEVLPEINIPLTGLYAKLDQLIAAISIPTTKEVLPEITIPLTGLYAKLDQLIAAATKPITKEVAPEITIPLTGLYAKLDQLIAVVSKPVAKEVLPEITIPLTGLYAKLDQLIAVVSKPVVKEVAPEINIPLTGLYAKLDQLIAIVSKPTTKEVAPEITIPLTGLYAKLDQLITAVSKPIVNQATPEITISLTGLYAKLDQLIAATSKAEITIPLTGLYAKMDQLIAAATKPTTKEAAPEVILPLAGLYAKIDQLIAATGKTEITVPLTSLYAKLDQLIAVTGKTEINIPLTGLYTKLDQLIAVSSTPATTISLTGLYEKIDQLIAATNNKPVVNETKTEIAIPLTGIYAKLDQLIAAAKESVTVIGLDKISSMISSLGEQRSIKKVVDKTPETVEALRNVITPLSTWKDKNKEETKTTPVEEKQIIKPVQTLAAGVGNDTATSLTALYAKMDQLILATKENTAATKETTAAVQKIDINPNLYLGTNKLNETIGLNTHRI